MSEASAPPERSEKRSPYERRRLTVLGTVADLTAGVPAVLTDGLGPGSIF